MDQKSSKWPTNLNYNFFAKTSVYPWFSDVFQCFFRFQPLFILDATIGTTFLRLFPIVAIVIANDHRQRPLAQVYVLVWNEKLLLGLQIPYTGS